MTRHCYKIIYYNSNTSNLILVMISCHDLNLYLYKRPVASEQLSWFPVGHHWAWTAMHMGEWLVPWFGGLMCLANVVWYVHSGVRRARTIQTTQLIINNTSFKTGIPTDLRSSLQYKNFDISHSFWGLMVAENRRLLVTMGSVIFWLAWIMTLPDCKS